ncbi:DCL family protein [Cryobacterium sp. Hb1]|uniref:DCL family protein n=1 Tax=Cryobacterium sp. Hb1 TaxID=1259147 RepID=UPI00106D0825|nr:DCL family protein [Cryobacterium sp. Hb1]TFD63736.1 DUF3223 domain-containing protein [Cryobacterium sp. Hb1]
MGKAIPVHLDSFTWETKGEAEAAFRAILHDARYAIYDRISDPMHDRMLRELVERHPEGLTKLGVGIDHFFIGRTRDGEYTMARSDATGIWLQRSDGEREDFGYLAAIRQHSPRSRAKEGLRAAITDRRTDFLESRLGAGGPVLSDLSREEIVNHSDAQVIYIDPTWEQLTYRFAQSEGGWEEIELDTGAGRALIGSQLANKVLENRWLEFFDKNAVFSLASHDEAVRRPRSDETAWRGIAV